MKKVTIEEWPNESKYEWIEKVFLRRTALKWVGIYYIDLQMNKLELKNEKIKGMKACLRMKKTNN